MTLDKEKWDTVKEQVTVDLTPSIHEPKVSVRYLFSGRLSKTLRLKVELS